MFVRAEGWRLGLAIGGVASGLAAPGAEPVPAPESPGEPFHFAHDIAPVLARAGCSAAECHGGAAGKGGFKLSLFSSDPAADFAAITREFEARRIDLARPEDSLFLRKPSRDDGLKHGGGRILKPEDEAFGVLRDWIARGTPWQSGDELFLTGLSLVLEGEFVKSIATFERHRGGGTPRRRDVTSMTLLESTNAGVASIDEGGRISREGPGEAWILARFGHLNARVPVLIPYAGPASADHNRSAHPLDRVWLGRLAELGIPPSGPAPPATVNRRLHLDLLGRPPSPLETGAAPDLDAMLASDDFARTWTRHVAGWFEVPIPERDPRNSSESHTLLRAFFLESLEAGDSLDRIARRILVEKGPGRAWTRFSDPRDRAEFVGRSLLGIRIGCARCHNHPLDRWKQEEHLRFSAFFSDDRPDPDRRGMMTTGRFFEPETGRLVEPALLPLAGGEAPAGPRREQIAWFVLDSEHDLFARNLANRIFGVLLGQSLVDAADDHRLSNPAIHEPVLELLASRLVELDYDLRGLVRFIVESELYRLSSDPLPSHRGLGGDAARSYLAHRTARRLSAVEFRRAVEFVSGVKSTHPLPPDSPLAEQLYVLNSGLIPSALATPGNQVDALFDFGFDPAAQLEDLYRLVLSRPPTEAEVSTFLPGLRSATDPKRHGRDLAFALLASREFGSVR